MFYLNKKDEKPNIMIWTIKTEKYKFLKGLPIFCLNKKDKPQKVKIKPNKIFNPLPKK